MDVTFDTNVLVAALLKPTGEHALAITSAFGAPDKCKIVYSSQMMAEYRDVLGRALITARGLSEEANALLDVFADYAEEIVPRAIPALVYPDDDDKPFLEAAVYTDGVLVTNNVRDYPFIGVRILRAGEFIDLLKLL